MRRADLVLVAWQQSKSSSPSDEGELIPRNNENQFSSTLIDIANCVPYFGGVTQVDGIAIQYYCTSASSNLSTHLSGRLWDVLVLHCSQSSPLIRQAVVALGRGHHEYCNDVAISQQTLSEYNRAIQNLRKYMTHNVNASQVLILLCCILFCTFEKLRNDRAAAKVHEASALSIMAAASNNFRCNSGDDCFRSFTDTHGSFNELAQKLVMMDTEAIVSDFSRAPKLKLNHRAFRRLYLNDIPMSFISKLEANEHFNRMAHGVWGFIQRNSQWRHTPIAGVPSEVVAERSEWLVVQEGWRNATNDLRQRKRKERSGIHSTGINSSHSSPTTPQPEDISAIREAIHHCTVDLSFQSQHCALLESLAVPPIRNSFDDTAELVLGTAQQALALQTAYEGLREAPLKRTFAPQTGIIECLLLWAHRTHVPEVRARALHIVQEIRELQTGITGNASAIYGERMGAGSIVLFEPPGH